MFLKDDVAVMCTLGAGHFWPDLIRGAADLSLVAGDPVHPLGTTPHAPRQPRREEELGWSSAQPLTTQALQVLLSVPFCTLSPFPDYSGYF